MTVSMKDIARRANVTEASVSLALRDHPRISVKRRHEIQKLAVEMGYQPNLIARALSTQKTNTIGLLMSNFHTGVRNLEVEAIERLLGDSGYQLFIAFTQGEGPRCVSAIKSMVARCVDGLFVVGEYNPADWLLVCDALASLQVPHVLVDPNHQPRHDRSTFVGIDRSAGYRAAAGHLTGLGHRDILFLCKSPRDLAKAHGLFNPNPNPDHELYVASVLEPGMRPASQVNQLLLQPGPTQARSAYDKGREFASWSRRATAVIASSDGVATAFCRGVQDAGLRVPADVSIVGFDGIEPDPLLEPRLVTVAQPVGELARIAAQMLLTQITEPSRGALPAASINIIPQLVAGASTASPSV